MAGKHFNVVFAQLLLFAFLKILPPCMAVYGVPPKWQDTTMCPYVSRWKKRALDFCRADNQDVVTTISRYHCVEKQIGGLVEICSDPIKIEKGNYPKWSSSHIPPTLYQESCPKGFYQPVEGPSYVVYKCKKKSECVESIGQLSSWCPDGGTTEDQQCRCDFQRGYISNLYAIFNPLNKSCFTPSFENSACSMYQCRGEQELDRAYRCVPKCPANWNRPPWDLECIPNPSSSSPNSDKSLPTGSSQLSTTSITTEIVTASKRTSIKPALINKPRQEENYIITVAIICSVIFFILLVGIIILIIVAVHYIRNRQPYIEYQTNIELVEHAVIGTGANMELNSTK